MPATMPIQPTDPSVVTESPEGNQASGSLSKNAYYDAYMAICGLSTALTYSEEEMAQFANDLAELLDEIYSEANSVLDADADAVQSEDGSSSKQQDAQDTYTNDSTYYQNLETEFNSMVNAANTSVNNLANGQTQLTQLASTMNGDLTYLANLLASPLAG